MGGEVGAKGEVEGAGLGGGGGGVVKRLFLERRHGEVPGRSVYVTSTTGWE